MAKGGRATKRHGPRGQPLRSPGLAPNCGQKLIFKGRAKGGRPASRSLRKSRHRLCSSDPRVSIRPTPSTVSRAFASSAHTRRTLNDPSTNRNATRGIAASTGAPQVCARDNRDGQLHTRLGAKRDTFAHAVLHQSFHSTQPALKQLKAVKIGGLALPMVASSKKTKRSYNKFPLQSYEKFQQEIPFRILR